MQATISDRKLATKVASQDRRYEREDMAKKIFVHLSTRTAMKRGCTDNQMRAAAKSIAMRISQQKRKAALNGNH